MDAYDFSRPLDRAGQQRSYCFGMDKGATVSALRQLADDIETGHTAVQEAQVTSIANLEDFPSTELRLKFIEQRPQARTDELRHLHAAGSLFPVATARVVRTED